MEDRNGVVAVIISEMGVDVKLHLWQLVQSHPVQERVCLASSVDWTTNGTVKPVVESGTVWIAFALGGVVAGDDVRCFMDVWLDGIRSKMCAEADHSWYWGNATHGTRRDVGTRGCWLVWSLYLDSDRVESLTMLLTETWRCVDL